MCCYPTKINRDEERKRTFNELVYQSMACSNVVAFPVLTALSLEYIHQFRVRKKANLIETYI